MGITLCDEQDIADRLGRNLSTPEANAWEAKAKEASVLIEGYLRREWAALGEVPDYVRVVCSRMVRRIFGASGTTAAGLPPNTRTFNASMGPLGHSGTFGDDVEYGDVFLTKADKIMLRKPIQVVHNEPMFSVPTYSQDGYDF